MKGDWLLLVIAVVGLFLTRFMPKYGARPGVFAKGQLSPISRQAMQILLSVGLTIAALNIILSNQYSAGDKHWAYGTVGTILGFWLRSSDVGATSRRVPRSRSISK